MSLRRGTVTIYTKPEPECCSSTYVVSHGGTSTNTNVYLAKTSLTHGTGCKACRGKRFGVPPGSTGPTDGKGGSKFVSSWVITPA